MRHNIQLHPDMKVLILPTTVRQFQKIISGEKKIETREIRPNTQDRYVILDDDEAITDIIPYDAILFRTFGASALVEIKSTKLYEIANDLGEPQYYDYHGKRHQWIDIDYTLGDVINKQGI